MAERRTYLETLPPNGARVVKTIWKHKGISRVELASTLGLDKSTVSKLVADLLEHGVVSEDALGSASPLGGRKPVLLSVRPSYGATIGIELQTERCLVTAVDMNDDIILLKNAPMEADPQAIPTRLAEVAEAAIAELSGKGIETIAVGVGMPGIVDPVRGQLKRSFPLRVKCPMDVVGEIARRTGVQAAVDNDAFCCCYTELLSSGDSATENFLVLLGEFRKETSGEGPSGGGIGVGLGFVLGGKVHHGADFSAGEFRSVFRRDDRKSQFSLEDEQVKAAERDEAQFEALALELGRNVALLVNTLDLSAIYLAGDFASRAGKLGPIILSCVRENWPYDTDVGCRVLPAPRGEYEVAYGAARMGMDALLDRKTQAQA
jgi:predicted NBD/HSP70 family sugar kinase